MMNGSPGDNKGLQPAASPHGNFRQAAAVGPAAALASVFLQRSHSAKRRLNRPSTHVADPPCGDGMCGSRHIAGRHGLRNTTATPPLSIRPTIHSARLCNLDTSVDVTEVRYR